MGSNKFKKSLEKLIAYRAGWKNVFKPDPFYLNLSYHLMITYHAGAVESMEDAMGVYDNILINSDILTLENLENWEPDQLVRIFRDGGFYNWNFKTIKSHLQRGDVFFWNYPKINKNGYVDFIFKDIIHYKREYAIF